jgi:nucleoside-diphosphate-sugar epimerase
MGEGTVAVICVTGASGRAGRAVVRDLIEHDYEVRAVDLATPAVDLGVPVLGADLTDYGQAVEALDGSDAVIHLANIPAPGRSTPAVTFTRNVAMNYAVFTAAAQLGLRRVVWASSETTLGLPFDTPPRYAPVDEDHYPLPTTAYALSKVASEVAAEHVARWSGIPFIALRFSNILGPADYPGLRSWSADPLLRHWNLWGYIDERDVAAACRLSLDADVTGSVALIIAAADTVMSRPSAELLAEVFPGVPLRREIGVFETLLSISRAREVLGFEPAHSWRDHVPAG